MHRSDLLHSFGSSFCEGKEDQLWVLEVSGSFAVDSNLITDSCINVGVKKKGFSNCILEGHRETERRMENSFISVGGTLWYKLAAGL